MLTSLPNVIRESGVEHDLHIGLCNLLLAGIRQADGIAIVSLGSDPSLAQVLHQERRFETNGGLRPSTRMIATALDQQRSILHLWDETASDSGAAYTQQAEFNWAFCTPFFSGVTDNRAVYVTGRSPSEGGARKSQSAACGHQIHGIHRGDCWLPAASATTRTAAGRTAAILSPPVLESLGHDLDTSLLEPRECDVTVMFCDLRGFSQQPKEQADNLTGLLERVSLALEVMTSQILRFGGVTGDFQGDAALGFWGWPIGSPTKPR